jgi:undecaprenyl-diphosphatase
MKSFTMRAMAALSCALALASNLAAEPLSKDEVNPIDRGLMFPYSAEGDFASDLTQYAGFLAPVALAAVAPASAYTELALMYAGSSVLAFGLGTGMKAVINRSRPYMYFDNPPADLVAEGDGDESFPSRHCCLAFSGAAFTATVFAMRYPKSKARLGVTAAAYGIAFATAALRVTSGNHFLTDVAAGAAIGTFSGFIVPFVVTKLTGGNGKVELGDGGDVSISPLGVTFTKRF